MQIGSQLTAAAERDYGMGDVHDNIRQEVFALAMQVGTLKTLIKRDVEAAQKCLGDIDHLLRLIQQDLALLTK